MSQPFLSKSGLILVSAEVTGPRRSLPIDLIVDTGATTSVIDRNILIALGFDLASATDFVRMTTGSTIESVPRVTLTRLSSLGQHRFVFSILAHSLPVSAQVVGLLGLDFLRGRKLTIDFQAGLIDLT